MEWSSTKVAAVVINEVMANPSGDEKINEWIELFNPAEVHLDIGGFVVTDYESSYTIPLGTMIEAGGFVVLGAESTKLQLANAGDEVVVKDQSGSVIDETAYSDAREQEDKSWARIPNGSGEFSFTSQVTKGAKNPMTKENGASVTLGSTTTPVSKPKLRLSEVYACPTSGESEWVEIVNEGTDGFDGIVKIKDAANNVLSYEIHIKAQELLALESSRQILNNTGDSVELVEEPFGTLDSMSYEKCEMGMSLVFGGGSWQLTTSVTRGGANILSQPTPAKVVKSPTSAVSPQQSPLPQVLGEVIIEHQMIEEDIDEEATVPAFETG